jgi:hypothetical protein
MQNYNVKLKTKKIVLNFELWFLVFLPVRCLTASILAQAGTQTGRFKFLVYNTILCAIFMESK